MFEVTAHYPNGQRRTHAAADRGELRLRVKGFRDYDPAARIAVRLLTPSPTPALYL